MLSSTCQQLPSASSLVQVHTGGQRLRSPAHSQGDFFPPTVVTGVTPAMDIWREEVFGPVMCISSFSSDDQAVALANDCAFGLGAAVFSRSQARARRIAAQLQVCPASCAQAGSHFMGWPQPVRMVCIAPKLAAQGMQIS